MHMAGRQLGSCDAETRTPQMNGGNPGAAAQSLAGPDAVAAIAVCRQGAVGELALVSEAESMPAVALDADALAEQFEDFDRELSTVTRLALKRALDVLLAVAAVAVVLPLLFVIGALIKLCDGGPVFFSQRRVGLHGRTFRMLKFRSMVTDAERLRPRLEIRNESSGPVFKMKLDPRVTAIGKFIRKYSLDELPQLINVLRGEMSIVGPRPSLPREVASYQPWQYRRFAVRPGLTCHWQVNPRRYQVSFDDWMRLDLKYVEEWSLRRDLDLILRTFRVVLGGTGE
jgi:lipopolysaccharide/colanic/teichoic acid biosynthesis glycosyltransferase